MGTRYRVMRPSVRIYQSNHTLMLVTGSFDGARRDGCAASPVIGSSSQMSALSSDISTNSRSRTFLTTFGGREAAGLYGPGEESG